MQGIIYSPPTNEKSASWHLDNMTEPRPVADRFTIFGTWLGLSASFLKMSEDNKIPDSLWGL